MEHHDKRPFLLTEGGPLYRIEKRVGLIRSRTLEVRRRAVISILFTWVPLFLLCVAQGTAFGHGLTMPFLKDFSAYTRFLIAIPLLLVADTIIGPRIAGAAEHFVTSGLVRQEDFHRFDEAVRKGLLLRDSVIAEIIIVILSYAITIGTLQGFTMSVSNWHFIHSDGGVSVSWAHWWVLVFCSPLLQFLLLRWFWRLILWFQFLYRMSLNLELFPTHPDEAAGLGFVGGAQKLFGVLLFAYSFAIVGILANQVVYEKVPLMHFAVPIGLYALLGVIVLICPLVIFSGKLRQTKRRGLYQYGMLATTYTGAFHRKWIRGKDAIDVNELLGSADIQSLADLGNSYSFIERMNAIPVDPRTILHLVVAMLLPFLPLLFTVMSPKEVGELLLKLLA